MKGGARRAAAIVRRRCDETIRALLKKTQSGLKLAETMNVSV
jgi:hypothetical protein